MRVDEGDNALLQVGGRHEGFTAMRLQAERGPDPVDGGMRQTRRRGHLSCLPDKANEGKLAGSVNCDKEIEIPFGALHLGDVGMA